MFSEKYVNVSISGEKYKIESDDPEYLSHVGKNFEPDMVKLFEVLAGNSKTVLDIGANIGCTAILFGGLADAVYAFEPSQTTHSFLEKNISNSGAGNIISLNMGLGNEDISSTLSYSASNRSGAFVSNQIKATKEHVVEEIIVRRLDDVVDSNNIELIDFIKIDTEGFEGHVLAGAEKTLRDHRPVVVMELNHWCLNAFQRTSVPDFFDQLVSIFPILYAVDGEGYLDLHNESDVFTVLYHHIINMRFPNIVAAFDESQVSAFTQSYSHGFNG